MSSFLYDDPDYSEPSSSSGHDVAKLIRAWTNERGAPELLPFEAQVVDSVAAMLEEQQNDILGVLSGDDATSDEEHFRLMLVQMDMERAKYVLGSYLRTRLSKIERHALYVLSDPSSQSRLANLELNYAKRYNALISRHFHASVLDSLPPNMRSLDDPSGGGGVVGGMVSQPDLDQAVFVRARRDCGEVGLQDGSTASLNRGTIHFLRYRSIRLLLQSNAVELL